MGIDPNFFGVTGFAFPFGTGSEQGPIIVGKDFDHSPADIIRHLLVNQDQGILPENWNGVSRDEWPISCNAVLPNPDRTIATIDTEGNDEGSFQWDGDLQGQNGVQFQIRADTFQQGWRKVNLLFNFTSKGVYDVRVDIDETTYLVHSITPTSDALPIGNETPTSKRQLFTLNLLTSISKIESEE